MPVATERSAVSRMLAVPIGLILGAAFLVVACGSSSPTGSPSASGSVGPSGSIPGSPAASEAPGMSAGPSASAGASSPGESPTPIPELTPAPGSPGPTPTPELTPAPMETPSDTPPPDYSPEPPPSFTPTPAPPSPVAIDACSLMSNATVTRVLFAPPASKNSGNGQGWIADSCTWLTAKGLPSVTVNVGTPASISAAGELDAATLFEKERGNVGKPYGTAPKKVAGVGDLAVFGGKLDNGQIVFVKGGYFVQISGIAVTEDRLIIAAKAVAAKL